MSAGDERSEPPLCPWCGVPWSEAMMTRLNAHSSGGFCACCAGVPNPDDFMPGPLGLPSQDVCCDSCGKPIYTAPEPVTRIVAINPEDKDGD